MKLVKTLYRDHPNLIQWASLALGMVIILVLAARDVGFALGQWAALVAATVVVAGLSVWIISWEDEDWAIDE